MQTSIARLTQDTLPDFFRVHSAANGADWCFCSAWWVPTWEGWGERSTDENRSVRQAHFDRDIFDGYLIYVNGQSAGWCQVGPRDRLEKLRTSYGLAPDPAIWAISCFLLVPSYRGQGLAHTFLEGILMDLSLLGVRRVQAFPRRGVDMQGHQVWTGPEAVFRHAGFTLKRDDPQKPLLEKKL